MDIDKFLEEIKQQLFSTNSPPVTKEEVKENTKLVFQNPIKGNYKNIGDFGVVNDTHKDGHQGIDIGAPKGTSIYPLTDGIVTKVGNDSKGGLAINIKHNNNYRSYYAHLDSVSVKAGDNVNTNTVIGTVGNSGNATKTSPHLHFQVWLDNKIINPAKLFEFKKYNT
jgi:murein DD-endopeptidase MepM/ murein hydrolase activator NlpD